MHQGQTLKAGLPPKGLSKGWPSTEGVVAHKMPEAQSNSRTGAMKPDSQLLQTRRAGAPCLCCLLAVV